MIDLLTCKFENVTLKQTLDIFVLPEIKKRRETFILHNDFKLLQFQILFHLTKNSPEIRLNDECKIVVEIDGEEYKKVMNESNHSLDTKKIKKIRLDDSEDGNCGHICFFILGDSLLSTYDFRYNKKIVVEHLGRAKEFIDTAEFALEKELFGAFVDNLYSASELIAKADLLLAPDKEILTSKSHKSIISKTNRNKNLSNLDSDFAQLLNDLSQLRNSGRYLNGGNLENSNEKFKELLSITKKFLNYVKKRTH